MKTLRLFFLIIAPGILSVPAVKAQNTKINFGIKAGVNMASLQTKLTGISENNWKIGYNTGVFARIGNRWYFQPEFAYRKLQNEYKFQAKKYSPTFHQLNLPLMVGYKIINKESIKFRLSIGPDLTYNLNKPEAPSLVEYKRFIVGAVLVAGVDFDDISIDVSYTGNVTLTTKVNADDLKKNNTNRGIIALSVGFRIL
ncbi:MAG: PorT family protein [Chitinophagaceae bacterium]|nr:PorT family protein [Chitinophagaceae bacterium]